MADLKRYALIAVAVVFLTPVSLVLAQRGGGTNWNLKAPWGATRQDATRNSVSPYKIFDNVYYVGLETVCSYLVTTSAGLVIIDSTYDDTATAVMNNVRTLGFNPADIKYVFVTHSHNDHLGGAANIKKATRAQVGMSLQDWVAAEGQRGGAGLARDLVLEDGRSITLGDTTFKFYVTPGHTPGSTSIEFQARDANRTYRTLVPGGLGMQGGPETTPVFLKSMERTKQLGPWDAMLGNHPWLMPVQLGEVQKALANRRGGAPHPAALGAAKNNEWLDQVIKVTKEKLAAGE